MRLWDEIRELTLQSTAPALIYEEGNLIKRSIRDLYARDIDEVLVDGEEGYRTAKAFMQHADAEPRQARPALPRPDRAALPPLPGREARSTPSIRRSCSCARGGYIVINPTEALVAIDVNSGRSTKERNIEETALKTNLEAAEEIARQLRLRDLAGLIVIDFIDMEEHRHQAPVERKLKDAMRNDRARIQIGRISRLRPAGDVAPAAAARPARGLDRALPALRRHRPHPLDRIDGAACAARHRGGRHAAPLGRDHRRGADRRSRSTSSTRSARRSRRRSSATASASPSAATTRWCPPAFRLERLRALTPAEIAALPVPVAAVPEPEDDDDDIIDEEDEAEAEAQAETEPSSAAQEAPRDGGGEARPERADGEDGHGRRRRRRRRRGGRRGRSPGRRDARAGAAGDRGRTRSRGSAGRGAGAGRGSAERRAPERRAAIPATKAAMLPAASGGGVAGAAGGGGGAVSRARSSLGRSAHADDGRCDTHRGSRRVHAARQRRATMTRRSRWPKR